MKSNEYLIGSGSLPPKGTKGLILSLDLTALVLMNNNDRYITVEVQRNQGTNTVNVYAYHKEQLPKFEFNFN
jgi:hypothetical protein